MAESSYPNLNPGKVSNNASSALDSAKACKSIRPKTYPPAAVSSTVDSLSNSQAYQSVANGPVADKAKDELNTTKNEFSNLAAARQTPDAQTATGQNLTHYHSLFYSLLSWENPRATAISYAATAISIIVFRYVPVDRYILKAVFTALGITAAAEVIGHLALGEGFASKIRPRKYYTIPRETLESVLGDIEQLINFFVIEIQRILFAENVYATIAAFFAALISYFLVKVTPYWGLALLSVTTVYFTPLIYISNKEFIDQHVDQAQDILSKQATQVRDIASEQTNKAYEATSTATQQYVSKAQEMIGGAKKSAVDQGYVSKETANTVPGVPVDKVNTTSFPTAPRTDPVSSQPSSVSSQPPTLPSQQTSEFKVPLGAQ